MTKVELFETELQEVAAIFKVLSHPARLSILQYLTEKKMCISGDISEELPLSRTTVHQHLAELKKLDLIKGEIAGAKISYCLNPEKIDRIKKRINDFLTAINGFSDNNC